MRVAAPIGQSSETLTPDHHHQHALLQNLLATSADLIAALDTHFRFTAFNDAFRAEFLRMIGREPLIGHSVLELLAHLPNERDNARHVWSRALAGESFSLIWDFAGENRRAYELCYAPVRDPDGRIIGARHVGRHVTSGVRNQLMDSLPTLFWSCRNDGYCDYLSPQWIAYTGAPEIEHHGNGWQSVIHPDDRAAIATIWDAATHDRATYNVEYRLRRHDGQYRWFSARGVAIRDQSGRILNWFGSCTDIHDRKLAEEALARSESELRAVFDVAAVGVVLGEPATGRLARCNARMCQITGYTVEELQGLRPSDLNCPEDQAADDAAIGPVFRGEKSGWDIEKRYRRKDGSTVWVHVSGSLIRSADGKPWRTVAIVQDISAAHQAMHDLQERQRRLDLAEVAAGIGAFEWIIPTDQAMWSDGLFRIVGMPPRPCPLPAKIWFDLIHPDDRQVVADAVESALATGELSFDLRIRRLDGQVRWLHSRGAVVRDDRGTPVRIFGINVDITDRKLAEERLAARERELKSLLDNIPDVVARWDRQMRYLYVSPSVERITGRPADSFVGRTVGTGGFDATMSQQAIDVAKTVFATGKPGTHEFRMQLPTGLRAFEARCVPEFSPAGAVETVLWVIRDISKRVAATEGLRKSEERYRTLVRTTPQFVWTATPDGVSVDGRAWVSQFTGIMPRADATPSWWYDAIHPEDRARAADAIQRAYRDQAPYETEFRLRRHDGEYRHLRIVGAPVREAGGAIREWIGTLADVTERRAAEDALRDSERRYRTLAETTADFVWSRRVDGVIDYVNTKWLQYTGSSLSEANVRGWWFYYHPDDVEPVRAALDGPGAIGPIALEFRYRRHDGEYRWFRARRVPVHDEAGNVVRYIGIATDVHDQKLAEDQLRAAKEEAEAASKAKDQFLATLSHELRTPLNPALLTATAMMEDPNLPAYLREDTALIRRSIELEARLIDDLLDLTRIARGKVTLHRRDVDLHELIHHSLQACLTPEVREKNIQVVLALTAEEHRTLADPARLQQVFWNLIKNAMKFTPAGGKVTIATWNVPAAEDGCHNLVIEVADNGIGIEPGELARIFDAFEQGGRSRLFGGLGLGLTISRALVELHGGQISAASGGRGRGARFQVVLRLSPEARSGAKVARPEPVVARPLAILLVEDHQPTLQVLRRLLVSQGHTVVAASTLEAARAQLTAQSFDLAISDLGLPDGSGAELLPDLSRHNIVAIAVSGYGTEQDVARSAAAGFAAHLTKPINFTQLQSVVGHLFPAR